MATALACALAVLAAVTASAGGFSEPYKALVMTTGDNSELTDHLDITNTKGANATTVMSLPLSNVKAGDRLRVSSEFQVTTDCLNAAGRCSNYEDSAVGHPYDYNPLVDARLVLASSSSAITGAPITGVLERRCRQQLPYRHHHCTLVFPSTTFDVPSGDQGRYVNLVASGWSPQGEAQPGDRLLVGENEPDGSILGDKGRVNAVRLRPDPSAVGTVQTLSSTAPVTTNLPIGNGSIENTVVFSRRLDNLKRNEQLEVAANLDTDIGQDQDPARPNYLPYNVLIRPRLILASTPTSTKVSDLAKKVSTSKGEITEANGFNCTHHDKTASLSPWDSPCHAQKAGVIKLTGDAKKLYVNLVIGTSAIGGTPRSGDVVHVAPCSPGSCSLQILRYPASLRG
jgi:hypothetical protein